MSRPTFHPARLGILAVLVTLLLPEPADAQIGRRIRQAAERAAEREVTRQVEERVTSAIRCAFDDMACISRAESDGRDVEYVDDSGRVLTGADGNPITDRNAAAQATAVRPGQGAWAAWDFVPGDTVLFADDFTNDRVGDFPRRWELISGNYEIVEWEGGRYVRVTGDGQVAIPLPRTLPEKFTVEFSVSLGHGNSMLSLTTAPYATTGARRSEFRGSRVYWAWARAGILPEGNQGPSVETTVDNKRYADHVLPVRVMADGDHMKVYWDDRRIANVPNAVFPRSDTLYLSFRWTREATPALIGPIRIAGGGLDLYDRLARDGRVATQGILFASGSDRLRPESTPVLGEIVGMLQEHRDLRLRIEGHTDDVGEEAFNQALSERRAAAVKAWLMADGQIAADRLEIAGFGESRPAVPGTTPEARQQNRRVELVDLRPR
ncbi:MAG: OmpA family protein [Gemmatimonadales bacterium]